MADWTIQRLDLVEPHTHTFDDFPSRLPNFAYDQALTEHRLLSGTVKYDKSAGSLTKRIHFAWEWVSKTERELLEDWADLACQMKVTWYDEDGSQHVDTGYMLLLPTAGTLFRKYTFGFTLVITNEE